MADTALEQFARVQMDVGDYEGAAATAAKMPGSESGRYTRAMVLRWVSLDQSRAGDPQEALARAERLSDPYNRVSALSGVAAGLLGIRRNDLPD
jgi:hypothetical protein